MTDGRIRFGEKDLGSGFALTDRIVATAAHVVRDRQARELTFVTAGWPVEVDRLEVDPSIDVAILWVARSLGIMPTLTHAAPQEEWRVTSRPQRADAQLTGAVKAIDHLIENTGGHEMTVLQLHVSEELRDYSGYSGSAVTIDGSIVGVLVEQVRERATPSGMRRMASNVLYAVPVDRLVARFRLDLKVGRPSAPPAVRQLLNTAYFDLDGPKNAILEAKSKATDRFLAFGVRCTELKVVVNLTSWLPTYIGEIAAKGQLSVKPEIRSAEAVVSYIARYSADLGRVNVLCPIIVDGVPPETITKIVDEVRAAIGTHQRWFVLLFAGEPSDGFPDSVVALPRPQFVRHDVDGWTRHIVALKRWPSPLATVWSDQIARLAVLDDGALDVRLTYEVLEDYIEKVRLSPAELLKELEELEAG